MIFEPTRLAKKTAQSQTALDQAAVACALERYRLAKGALPEKLDALVPEFIAKVPYDVIDGQPLRYITDDHGYAFYSVGRNRIDEHGAIASGTQAGDIVFRVERPK